MKFGIVALGVFSLLDTLELLRDTIYIIKVEPIIGTIYIISLYAMVYNLYIFAKYFAKDTYLTRS